MNRNSQGIRTSIKALLSSLFTTFIVTLGFQSSLCATEQNQKTVTLGISEFASHNINELIIEDTIKTLQKALKNNKLVVKRLNLIGITNAVKSKELGLVLTSAGAFRRLVIERTGLRDLATVASDLAPNPNYADGSVFFVRRDREDIKTIADLKGRVASANYPYAFSGWQIAMGELLKQGFAPDNFFKKTLFLGHDAYPAIQAVLDKKADVGIARACFLEYSGLLEQNQLKIIGAKPSQAERSSHVFTLQTFIQIGHCLRRQIRHLRSAGLFQQRYWICRPLPITFTGAWQLISQRSISFFWT